ncbi:hypothetical protein [Cellulosimicrobium composti]|uniref:hypothetical protein n=1 Tax=Cellulosimicrobium composti TaxID=2672572 RepID=UPI0018ACE095|nr:hypothetical protein [Cellulosimicrobium composti]
MTSLRRPRSPLSPSRRSPLAGRALVVALGAASALALAGCTGDAEEGPTPVAVGAAEYQPILETRQPVPGSAEDEVTIGLVSLTADGSTVELRVLLTPHFAGDDPTESYSVYDMFGRDHDPRIVDVGTLTEYKIVSSSGTTLSTDPHEAETVNGRPVLYQAWFPRPEGEPATVDVRLNDSWPALEDVPVTWESEE